MENTLEILKNSLPEEIRSTLRVRKFSPGEPLIGLSDRCIAYIKKGVAIEVITYPSREYIVPIRFIEKDIAGFHGKFLAGSNWAEFRALTEVEAVVFPENIVRTYFISNLETYRLLSESSFNLLERIGYSLYIQTHGGAKALLAYMLIEYSVDNEYQFIKYENISKSLNVSRARLYKVEEEFTTRGIIRKERKKIIILNREKLKDYYRNFLFMDTPF